MESVKVDKEELLRVLKENRERHHAIFIEAQQGYRQQVVKELDDMLREAREGRRIRRSITLVEPMNQTKDYDRAIRMLEMSTEKQILVSERDFNSYVLDEWDWKQKFNHSNRSYSNTLMGMLPLGE